MSFRTIDFPPASDILHMPPKGDASLIALPPEQLFDNEISYWRTQLKNEQIVDRDLAQSTLRRLSHAAAISLEIQEHIRENKLTTRLAEDALAAYGHITTTTAHTRMLRELFDMGGLSQDSNASDTEELSVGHHIDYDDLIRSGAYLSAEAMEDIGISPPEYDDSQWYEGEGIYLRATRPANPTQRFKQAFEQQYNQPFPITRFISVAPRLKVSYWTDAQARQTSHR